MAGTNPVGHSEGSSRIVLCLGPKYLVFLRYTAKAPTNNRFKALDLKFVQLNQFRPQAFT